MGCHFLLGWIGAVVVLDTAVCSEKELMMPAYWLFAFGAGPLSFARTVCVECVFTIWAAGDHGW
jgi:hypothetical protein